MYKITSVFPQQFQNASLKNKKLKPIVIYRMFNYLKHHVYYVSINTCSFIYYVSKDKFLELHVYNNMLFGLSYFWHIIEYLEVS